MPILDYVPPSEEIAADGKPLMKVRGLSLEDVSRLIRDHLDDINRITELWSGAQAEIFARLNTDGFLLKLFTDFPVLVCETIARAAGEYNDETVTALMTFPASLQLKALRAIVKLTLEDMGGPKGITALWNEMKTN